MKRNLRREGINNKYFDKTKYSVLLNSFVSLFVSVVTYKPLAQNFLLFVNSVTFNRTENITGLDLSYFFFIKPFLAVTLEIFAVIIIV